LILFASFIVILCARLWQYNKTSLYPQVTCGPFYDTYPDTLGDFALIDYDLNKLAQDKGRDSHFAGYMQCFCDKELALEKEIDAKYGPKNQPICHEYQKAMNFKGKIGTWITIFVITIN
jgi:hypothetical protein